MVLNIASDLEAVLNEEASRQGMTAEELATNVLRERFVRPLVQPRDDWGRRLLAGSCDCGVSLSNEAVSSEGIYD